MIFFIPTYDEQTLSNLNAVQNILPTEGVHLIGENALREQLLIHLPIYKAIFAMCHGESHCFFDNSNQIAISVDDSLVHKKLFIFACLTANELGKHIQAQVGNVFWGYTGRIAAPIIDTDLRQIYQPIFQFIIQNFSNSNTIQQIETAILTLKNLAETAANILDDNGIMETEPHMFLLHVWSRLRVMINPDIELCHPNAEPSDLF